MVELIGSEVEVVEWRVSDIVSIGASLCASPVTSGVPVIGVDGRSGGGKTTFARALATELDAALLSTDDVAWWHDPFDGTGLLIPNLIEPLRAGRSVDYRPPAWVERGRVGSITARASAVVVVEGVGAAQQAMRHALDAIVWMQSDAVEAERRGVLRDLVERPDPAEAKRFWDEWMAAEIPFQEAQRTWEVADLTVCGTPDLVPGSAAGGAWLVAHDSGIGTLQPQSNTCTMCA